VCVAAFVNVVGRDGRQLALAADDEVLLMMHLGESATDCCLDGTTSIPSYHQARVCKNVYRSACGGERDDDDDDGVCERYVAAGSRDLRETGRCRQ
jgi:hypothetical protein